MANIIKVENHKRERGSSFITHTAEVTVDGPVASKEQLIFDASVAVNYHPYGYGIYGTKSVEELGENKYLLKWQTGASSD